PRRPRPSVCCRAAYQRLPLSPRRAACIASALVEPIVSKPSTLYPASAAIGGSGNAGTLEQAARGIVGEIGHWSADREIIAQNKNSGQRDDATQVDGGNRVTCDRFIEVHHLDDA